AVCEVERGAQRPGGAAPVVVAHDHVRGPVAPAVLQPEAVGPGDVEVAAVVLVERLLHDVVDAERGLEAAHAQTPRRVGRAVFEVGLVDRGLAVAEAGRPGRPGPQPGPGVVLLGVQPGGGARAGVPAATQRAGDPEARAHAEAVGVGGGPAAGAAFGGDVAETGVAAGLPGIVGLDAGGGGYQDRGKGGAAADVHGGVLVRSARRAGAGGVAGYRRSLRRRWRIALMRIKAGARGARPARCRAWERPRPASPPRGVRMPLEPLRQPFAVVLQLLAVAVVHAGVAAAVAAVTGERGFGREGARVGRRGCGHPRG